MYKYTYIFLVILTLFYGLIPLQISSIIGTDFLIGEFSDYNLKRDIFIYTFLVSFSLLPLLKKNIIKPRFNGLGKLAQNIGFRIYYLYLIFLVILGLFLRKLGFDRLELLSILSSTFLQGMGLIMSLFYLSIIKKTKTQILIISFLFVMIDIFFMGKQYFIALITLLFFLADYHKIKVTITQIILIFLGGVLFIFLINFSRGDFSQIDFYSTLMEFRAVLSSIQFSKQNISFLELNQFRTIIEEECFSIYGYNLAFHPLLYFRSLYGGFFLNIFLYILFLFILFKFIIRYLGAFGVLIITLNFIHFLRHGIDIFLIKILVQSFMIFVFILKYNDNLVFDENSN
jgi:hypothetical protein